MLAGASQTLAGNRADKTEDGILSIRGNESESRQYRPCCVVSL